MARFHVVLGLLCSVVYLAYAAKPLFDPTKCPNGCQMDDQCPTNAVCNMLNNGGTCGFCVCQDGYKAQGNKCNPVKGYSTTTTSTTTTSTTTASTTTTTAASTTQSTTTTSTTTVPTTTGTTTQGPPPTPPSVVCSDYDCTAVVNTSSADPNCKRELATSPRKCTLAAGGSCYGSYCLNVSPGVDYCICPYYKTDRQCVVDKPGKCSAATGQVPSSYAKLPNTRLQNPSDKNDGSIYGRHFAANLQDCIKLCQWSQGPCKSVNFGPINGVNVCEMLSIAATPENLLKKWLQSAAGWQYAQLASQ